MHYDFKDALTLPKTKEEGMQKLKDLARYMEHPTKSYLKRGSKFLQGVLLKTEEDWEKINFGKIREDMKHASGAGFSCVSKVNLVYDVANLFKLKQEEY